MIIFIYGYDDPFYMDTEYPTSLSPPSSSLSSLLKSKKTNSMFQNLHTFYWINGIDSWNPYRGYYESYMNKRKYPHHHHHHHRRRRRHRRHHQNRQFLSLQTDLFKLLKGKRKINNDHDIVIDRLLNNEIFKLRGWRPQRYG
ncbi:unnamed protein product [Schistosoma margrebowiei]|uniref:Uncharacterized protein n=1 Tax=Schistosoma margrebowiei TaxID=48269 RepID=A0AA85AIH7_9TREM|nr:unnamed protein product [Schistosoma margrebowiei]